MAYNLKDVFYLDTQATVTGAQGGGGSAQLDLSAYIDPIARGRTKGTGLAVYKVHMGVYDDAHSEPVNAAEAGVMSMGMVAGLGAGDNATGAIAIAANALTADNQLVVASYQFYSPAAGGAAGNAYKQATIIEPSKDVPYVIVRDNVCLLYSVQDNFTGGQIISVRLEVAQISLDQATLNQLLRTQTV